MGPMLNYRELGRPHSITSSDSASRSMPPPLSYLRSIDGMSEISTGSNKRQRQEEASVNVDDSFMMEDYLADALNAPVSPFPIVNFRALR